MVIHYALPKAEPGEGGGGHVCRSPVSTEEMRRLVSERFGSFVKVMLYRETMFPRRLNVGLSEAPVILPTVLPCPYLPTISTATRGSAQNRYPQGVLCA